MKKFLVDGRFLNSLSSGVDRYAFQILKELDRLAADLDISILVPPDAKQVPDYQNIRVIHSHRRKHWTQLVFGWECVRRGAIPINLCNEMPLIGKKGISCLHDVLYAETPEVFPWINDYPKDEREWFLKIYERIKKRSAKILTVSEFSKQRAMECLGIPEDRFCVVPNGWQHFNQVETDDSLMKKYPELVAGEYFFTLTSSNRNKNVDWVLANSKLNEGEHYCIAGKGLDQLIDFGKYPNVTYVGFASDVLAKTLMKHAKAFLFPSFYEGFGIPPLEAMSTGTPVIVSKAASLPEIFGTAAHYIDPTDPALNVTELMKEPVSDPQKILNRYSWSASAAKLKQILEEF